MFLLEIRENFRKRKVYNVKVLRNVVTFPTPTRKAGGGHSDGGVMVGWSGGSRGSSEISWNVQGWMDGPAARAGHPPLSVYSKLWTGLI